MPASRHMNVQVEIDNSHWKRKVFWNSQASRHSLRVCYAFTEVAWRSQSGFWTSPDPPDPAFSQWVDSAARSGSCPQSLTFGAHLRCSNTTVLMAPRIRNKKIASMGIV